MRILLRFGFRLGALVLLANFWGAALASAQEGSLLYNSLTAEARANIQEIIREHPKQELIRSGVAGGAPEEERKLRIFTNFIRLGGPDWKSFRPGAPYEEWVYVRIPFVPTKYAGRIKASSYSTKGKLVDALEENLKVIRNPRGAEKRRAEALWWVLYLMPKIHNPIYCVALYMPGLTSGDEGGERFYVRQPDSTVPFTLSDLWQKEIPGQMVKRLRSRYPDMSKFPDLAAHTTPQSWAEESWTYAKSHVYLDGELPAFLRPSLEQQGKPPGVKEVPGLPAGYVKQMGELRALRELQCTYRLVQILNESFGTAPAVAVP